VQRMVNIISSHLILVLVGQACADSASDLVECLNGGQALNVCTEKTLENFRPIMETGQPELGLPPLDPLAISTVSFTFWNVTTAFYTTKMRGFKNFRMKYSRVNKQERTWSVGMSLPKISATGTYELAGSFGTLDLGRSAGDARIEGENVDVSIEMKLGSSGSKILVTELNLQLDPDSLNLELECLFPKEDGACCPRRYLKSCNVAFTQLLLRKINEEGLLIEEFQPPFARKIGLILQDYLNKALSNLDAKYLIDL